MTYVHIMDNRVRELIPEKHPDFPGVPIKDRYTAEFLSQCVKVKDAEGIEQGMLYNPETGEFSAPPPPPEPEPWPEPIAGEPSEREDMAALLVDHEYRLTLMELGL